MTIAQLMRQTLTRYESHDPHYLFWTDRTRKADAKLLLSYLPALLDYTEKLEQELAESKAKLKVSDTSR